MINPTSSVVVQLVALRSSLFKEIDQVDRAIKVLEGGHMPSRVVQHRRSMSQQSRDRISRAQKERWARQKAETKGKHSHQANKNKQQKRKLHWTQRPENRARVLAATRKMSRARGVY